MLEAVSTEAQAELERLLSQWGLGARGLIPRGFAKVRETDVKDLPEQVHAFAVNVCSRVEFQAHVRIVASDVEYPSVASMAKVSWQCII